MPLNIGKRPFVRNIEEYFPEINSCVKQTPMGIIQLVLVYVVGGRYEESRWSIKTWGHI
jgi:hypothetical protein